MNGRMMYENFLKAVYHCGRFGKMGVNADLFDGLQNKEMAYRDAKNQNESIEQIERATYEYGLKLGEIRAFVCAAIERLIPEHPEIERELSQFNDELFLNDDVNANKIIETISKVSEIAQLHV
jgi:hypothetical protein